MRTFKEIIAWQKAYQLTLLIYKYTADFPRSEEFGLKSQIRSAAVSVISNIAEGFKRNGKKDRLCFYNRSEASLEEVKCQSLLSSDLKYINQIQYAEIEQLQDETGRVLDGWIKSQQ